MTTSRFALTISTLYSIPLLIWFLFSLQFVDWNPHSLQSLFNNTYTVVLLLQALALPLCFIYRSGANWHDDAIGVLHIILFPLPLITLSWLTGSVSATAILTAVVLLTGLSILLIVLQQLSRLITDNHTISQPILSSLQLIITVLVWNYRDLWQGWIM